MTLRDLLEPYKTIGTMGICKNAGKTTVLNYLVKGWHDKWSIGMTSIGYDGEARDGITLLPKPRIQFYPGMMALTCQTCLDHTTASFEVIEATGLTTVFGQVCIVRCLEEGILELSGPSSLKAIEVMTSKLLDYGCDKVIIDGAAGRTAFGHGAEACVLSIGAGAGPTEQIVIGKGAYLTELMAIGEVASPKNLPDDKIWEKTFDKDLPTYVFRGVVADRDLQEIMADCIGSKKVIAKDASALFIDYQTYRRFIDGGGSIEVLNGMNLVALTVNPMNPYGPWMSSEGLIKGLEERTPLPVFDIGGEV